MNINKWLTWPTGSNDPALNFAVLALLALLAFAAIVVGAMFLIPIFIALAIAKGVQWYMNRPLPTADIYAQTHMLSQQVQFPKLNDFLQDHLQRLMNAWHGNYPAYSVYLKVADVAEKLYKAEGLADPVSPLPGAAINTIEEGRYRDRLLGRIRTMENARCTLDYIHKALGEAFITFTRHLPPIARADRQSFAEAVRGDKPPYTIPLIDVLPSVGNVVHDLFSPFFTPEAEELELFTELRKQLEFQYPRGIRRTVSYPSGQARVP